MTQCLDQTVTLLHVDDFEPWYRCARELLLVCPEWKIVATACDGEEAVRKATELQPDVILLDIGLPKLNGIEAARRIRNMCPRSQIVFLAQQRDPDLTEAALAIAGTRFVLKDHATSELVPAITAALADENSTATLLQPVTQ
jgi:DNA-binding NarL/FixJ family response regulator